MINKNKNNTMVYHGDISGETGGTMEQYFGGESAQSRTDLQYLVDDMAKKGQLFNPDYNKNPKLREKIQSLPGVIKELLDLSEIYKITPYKNIREKIIKNMVEIKKKSNHDLLFEALIRYSINAMPEGYNPSKPGPLKPSMRRRLQFAAELQEKICKRFGVKDTRKVKFFNTINTPLDFVYSTDGFFVIDGSVFLDDKRRILTVDITGDTSKKDMEFNPSGSMVLYLERKDLDDEELEKYRETFSKKISSVLLNTKPDNMLDGFISKFDRTHEGQT